MAPAPKAPQLIDFMLLQAERERRLAQECRDIARRLHLRPDRERVLEMARWHDAEAARLEATAGKG